MKECKLRSVMMIFISSLFIMGSSCGKSNSSSGSDAVSNSEDSFLQASPTSLLSEPESDTAFSNGFIYYGYKNSLIEFDTESGKTATISPKISENTFLSCYSPYDGYIYAVKMVLDTTDNTESYSIVRIDFNTSDMEEIYSPEDKADVIDCMTVSNDGRLFFSQGHFTGGNTDENGFCKDYYVYSYDISSKKTEKLVCASSYYIYDDTIYFTRLNESSDTERLFYAKISKPDDITDTKADVVAYVSENTPYMYYPVDGKVYYSTNDNTLRCYDVAKGESSDVCTFDDDTYVRYFQKWNGKMIILLREHCKDSKWYQYGLYYLDKNNKPVKILDEEYFNKDYPLGFEYIDFMTIFDGCDSGFIISNYNVSDDRRVYLVDKDFKLTKVIETGGWDYKSYEEEQQKIEELTQNYQDGGQ